MEYSIVWLMFVGIPAVYTMARVWMREIRKSR